MREKAQACHRSWRYSPRQPLADRLTEEALAASQQLAALRDFSGSQHLRLKAAVALLETWRARQQDRPLHNPKTAFSTGHKKNVKRVCT